MDMEKKEDPKKMRLPSPAVVFTVLTAFACGGVANDVGRRFAEADSASRAGESICKIDFQGGVNDGNSITIQSKGALDACASIALALQQRANDAAAQAQDDQSATGDDQTTDAPCDSASDAAANEPKGASK